MPDWKQRRYLPGTRVMVSVCQRKGRTRPPQQGVLLTTCDLDDEHRFVMPRIRIHSGRVARGSECWWIPIAEIR